ncbi:MAG: 5'-methylthioadenosine/S-adenosylhomocysteine nucleosidase [Candidatus Zixiibacteriota bacterium]
MKRRFHLLFVIITILIILSCGKQSFQGRVAIMYAFNAEGELLRSHMTLEDSLYSLKRIFWIGKIQDKDVIVVKSNVGMTNAAMTAQLLIDRFKPKQLIFTGICGGIDPENNIGDIVIPESWATHDYGIYNQEGFQPWRMIMTLPGKDKPDTLIFLPVDNDLLKITENIEPDLKPILGRTPKIKIGGKGVSGNSFIDQVEKREELKEKFDAQIVDMESAAVVQVAILNKVPVLVVRSCSDLAGGSGSSTAQFELEEFFEVAADNSASFVLELLRQL